MSRTLEDVEKVIEACKNAGVSRIKWDKLEITFHPQADKAEPTATGKAELPKEKISRAIEREIETDPDLNDLELQTLMISDPQAFEEYLRKAAYGEVNSRSERDVYA